MSIIAFVLFGLELTNEVYGREVFDLLPWNEHSSESAFAAAGRSDALVNKALALRTAPVALAARETPSTRVQSLPHRSRPRRCCEPSPRAVTTTLS